MTYPEGRQNSSSEGNSIPANTHLMQQVMSQFLCDCGPRVRRGGAVSESRCRADVNFSTSKVRRAQRSHANPWRYSGVGPERDTAAQRSKELRALSVNPSDLCDSLFPSPISDSASPRSRIRLLALANERIKCLEDPGTCSITSTDSVSRNSATGLAACRAQDLKLTACGHCIECFGRSFEAPYVLVVIP